MADHMGMFLSTPSDELQQIGESDSIPDEEMLIDKIFEDILNKTIANKK